MPRRTEETAPDTIPTVDPTLVKHPQVIKFESRTKCVAISQFGDVPDLVKPGDKHPQLTSPMQRQKGVLKVHLERGDAI